MQINKILSPEAGLDIKLEVLGEDSRIEKLMKDQDSK